MKLTARGFRGRTIDIDLPRRLLLAGPNGAGKTNILDALEIALTGEAPTRLGKAAVRMVPYLSDTAATCLEGSDPFWQATTTFRRTPKSAKFDHVAQGTPPVLRPLFVDFGAFLDSPAERKRLLDGLIELSEASVLEHAQAAAQEAARAILTPAVPTWTDAALDLLPGLSDDGRKALTSPTLEALEKALAAAKALYAAAKGAADLATANPTPTDTRDPAVIASEISEARNTLAKIEAQDRDSRSVLARRNSIEGRLSTLWAVDPSKRQALEAELQTLEGKTPPGTGLVDQLAARLEQIVANGKAGNERFKALRGGKCPTCGTDGPVLASAVATLRAELEALGAQRDEVQAELALAREAQQRAVDEYRTTRDRIAAVRAELRTLPVVDPQEIVRLEAELEGLPNAFLAGDELEALRLRVQHLEQEAEVARAARAETTVVTRLNLPALELQGKVFRAAIKGWEQGRAAAAAEVVGPIAARMSETLKAEVAIDPENTWTISVAGRPAESYSGGQRLAIWGAFVGALCRPGDVLLCEAAEADADHLENLLEALTECPAALAVVATHHTGMVCNGWTTADPRNLK